ncbi:hypothetical protein GCM10027059_30340 [Myceligenerans halotolerans]
MDDYILIGAIAVAIVTVTNIYFLGVRSPHRLAARTLRKAHAASEELARARQEFERKRAALQQKIDEGLHKLNFETLRQDHRESREVADVWYRHVKQAGRARYSISNTIEDLKKDRKRLARKRDRARGTAHNPLLTELESLQTTIDATYTTVESLREGIDQGYTMLDDFNQRTGQIRDHIRDNCGLAGREWYESLMQRTERRQEREEREEQ